MFSLSIGSKKFPDILAIKVSPWLNSVFMSNSTADIIGTKNKIARIIALLFINRYRERGFYIFIERGGGLYSLLHF